MKLLISVLLSVVAIAAPATDLTLAGTWKFRLDPAKAGHGERWYDRGFDRDTIFLPGSTDQGGYGTKTVGAEKGWLSRPYTYAGRAWYQREVTIPDSWAGRRITLFLERPHWSTEVWVDSRAMGTQNSLATPHIYNVTEALPPGRHRLTICVDNSYLVEVGVNAHSVTEHTQTNWNGIIGRIELRASAPVWIDSVRVAPDLAHQQLAVTATVRNGTGAAARGELRAAAIDGKSTAAVEVAPGAESSVRLTLPIPANARRWDEYEGFLHRLDLKLSVGALSDEASVTFGLRDITTSGSQFRLNGRPILLRGTLECSIFPRTGYPPTTVDEWARLFRIARSYGLNHFRFHSWCPPEAAFIAADQAGFLLHVELPVWSNKAGKDTALDEFMRAEGYRILKTYGNHPSFTMLCLGNELVGDDRFMDGLVAEFKQSDPRRLYTFSADHRRRAPGPTSDYYVTHHTAKGPVRVHGARYTKTMDGTDFDFSEHVAATPMPLVAHELGQWVTFPSYEEIPRYTGVLKPRNLEAFREQLAARGMLDQAREFQLASGRFAWRLYKEDIEAVYRTPGMGGYQLLQLQDFPGQGEALIGILDSFWKSKGIMTPREFRRFSGETVALLRMKKFVWTSGETFIATASVSHYGKKPIEGVKAAWWVVDDSGRRVTGGEFAPANLGLGSVTQLGEIRAPLAGVPEARHYRIFVRAGEAENDWDVWVYPEAAPAPEPMGVLVTSDPAAARKALDEGRKVMLLLDPKANHDMLQQSAFLPVFWSLSWFPKQPGTMGILVDPKHPALARFPTEARSDFQWWDITEGSRAFILNDAPPGFRPLVQVIDDYHRNQKLGAVIEARVAEGKLLAVSFDLRTRMESRPAARQLLRSLMEYTGSAAFNPPQELPAAFIEKLTRQ